MVEQERGPRWRRWIIGGALIFVLGGVSAFGLIIPQAGDDPRARIQAIQAATGATASIGAAVTVVLVARRQLFQERAHHLQERVHQLQVEVHEHNRFDADERRITDQFVKAVEQLGHDKAAVRLGGLYALDRLGRNHPDQRQTIADVWCGYLRGHFKPTPGLLHTPPGTAAVSSSTSGPAEAPSEVADLAGEYQVRMTAQRLLIEHLRDPRPEKERSHLQPPEAPDYWTLRKIDLTGATLMNADFNDCYLPQFEARFATFYGASEFANAIFSADARFTDARFIDEAHFPAAVFAGTADFNQAHLHKDAEFRRTTFHEATDFRNATFAGPGNFFGAQFGWVTRFWNARFDAEADFERACFYFEAMFASICFERFAGFKKARFLGPTAFGHASFGGPAVFETAQFGPNTTFTNANFFDSATFMSAYFDQRAAFEQATFATTARFSTARFRGPATFRSVRFEDTAHFKGVEFSDKTHFNAAVFNGHTDFSNLVTGLQSSIDLSKAVAATPEGSGPDHVWPAGWHGKAHSDRLLLAQTDDTSKRPEPPAST